MWWIRSCDLHRGTLEDGVWALTLRGSPPVPPNLAYVHGLWLAHFRLHRRSYSIDAYPGPLPHACPKYLIRCPALAIEY